MSLNMLTAALLAEAWGIGWAGEVRQMLADRLMRRIAEEIDRAMEG